MDYKKYSEELEKIIGAITVPEHTRILMHALVKQAREKAEDWAAPVEPKFKVGDWVVFNNNHNSIYQISKIKDSFYILIHIYDGSMPLSFSQEGLIRPWTTEDAKDGDVLALNGKPFIYSSHKYGKNYCYIDEWGQLRVNFSLVFEGNYVCPATKQERDLLFSKMREVGYEWDADKKELRKIKHYDISSFYTGMPVLVREYDTCHWQWVLYSHFNGVGLFFAAGKTWRQCIPFEGNEHLLGTTDMPSEEYINW